MPLHVKYKYITMQISQGHNCTDHESQQESSPDIDTNYATSAEAVLDSLRREGGREGGE